MGSSEAMKLIEEEESGEKAAIKIIKQLMAKKGPDGTPVTRELSLTRLELPQVDFLSASRIKTWTYLEKLDLSRNNLSEIDAIESIKNLKTVDISYNYIEELGNISLPNLQNFILRNNYIRTFPVFEFCKKLKYLDLRNNLISDLLPLNANYIPNLKSLDLRNNKIDFKFHN